MIAATDKYLTIQGVRVPRFLYGTAWKEDETQPLTELALQEGFRGIDTANQRQHYYEEGVGKALASQLEQGSLNRDEVFLQTKFTFRAGQDHRLPYDPSASINQQVEQSFASSLEHLGVQQVDSYVLHGPSQRFDLGTDDWEAWRAMEALHERGAARLLGISNVSLEQLEALCREARVPPSFVQNRCFAINGWDYSVREFCAGRGIVYQGFSLLTANRDFLQRPELTELAERYGRNMAQLVFRFALDVGMIPLTGTTDVEHMRSDLEVFDFELGADDVVTIERLAAKGQ